MKPELKYVELKTGFSDNGPAWVGMVDFSKSKQTVYFNGKALKNLNGKGTSGNYFDVETGEEYWVSGIKKDGTNRLSTGIGKIMIDRKCTALYLKKVGFHKLNKNQFELIEIKPTNKARFTKLENKKLN